MATIHEMPDRDGGAALTNRQQRVLDVIRDSVDARGYPPSLREIGEAVGVDLGYEVFVVEDACATLDPNLHENSIAAMEVLSANIMTVQLALDSRNESS